MRLWKLIHAIFHRSFVHSIHVELDFLSEEQEREDKQARHHSDQVEHLKVREERCPFRHECLANDCLTMIVFLAFHCVVVDNLVTSQINTTCRINLHLPRLPSKPQLAIIRILSIRLLLFQAILFQSLGRRCEEPWGEIDSSEWFNAFMMMVWDVWELSCQVLPDWTLIIASCLKEFLFSDIFELWQVKNTLEPDVLMGLQAHRLWPYVTL